MGWDSETTIEFIPAYLQIMKLDEVVYFGFLTRQYHSHFSLAHDCVIQPDGTSPSDYALFFNKRMFFPCSPKEAQEELKIPLKREQEIMNHFLQLKIVRKKRIGLPARRWIHLDFKKIEKLLSEVESSAL